ERSSESYRSRRTRGYNRCGGGPQEVAMHDQDELDRHRIEFHRKLTAGGLPDRAAPFSGGARCPGTCGEGRGRPLYPEAEGGGRLLDLASEAVDQGVRMGRSVHAVDYAGDPRVRRYLKDADLLDLQVTENKARLALIRSLAPAPAAGGEAAADGLAAGAPPGA